MYPYVSALVWATIMLLFEIDPTVLQNSLNSSMKFLYLDSDTKIQSIWDLLPF